MKQVKFKGRIKGKEIKGNWFCEARPNNAKRIAERLVSNQLGMFIKFDTFMFVVKEIRTS